ncbi:MAG: response regulator [Gammaproteobacteria bacterium]|jgi:DNA-binding NarL/FixJ family response regulator
MSAQKILVVDDDQTTRKVLELQLKNLGYEVLAGARTAREGIEKTDRHSPQLVLMDINLGKGMDGIEAARTIMREHATPVVFITAYGNEKNLGRAKQLNPAGFINKPVRENDLYANIEIALGRQAADEEMARREARRGSRIFQVSCNPEGMVSKRPTRIEQLLKDYKVDTIYELMPRDHKEHVATCLRNKKPQMLSGRIDDHILSWEYQPTQTGKTVRISAFDITEQYGTAELSVDQASLSDALDHLASGVILVNEHLKVFYYNQSAQKFFESGSVLKHHDGYLSLTTPELTAELHQLVLKDTGDTLSVNRGSHIPPLHIFVSPMHSRASNYGQDMPIAVLFLFETVNDVERIGDVVRTLYNLSPTESRIAALLVFNPHLDEVAASLGITYNTARTHLKRIYLKTGTNRLSALVHRIMTGPVGILLHSHD